MSKKENKRAEVLTEEVAEVVQALRFTSPLGDDDIKKISASLDYARKYWQNEPVSKFPLLEK